MGESSQEVLISLENIYYSLEYLFGIFDRIFGLAEMGFAGVMLTWALISAIVSAVVSGVISLIFWLLKAIPVYKLAKKLHYKYAILAWIPILSDFFISYVEIAMVGDKPFRLFGGKINYQNRAFTFWFYIGIYLFGNALVTALVGILNVLPGLGQVLSVVASLLYLLPSAALSLMNYAYIKDIADCFNANQKVNRNAAILVTVLDTFATLGFARIIYFYTLLKKEPLSRSICEVE